MKKPCHSLEPNLRKLRIDRLILEEKFRKVEEGETCVLGLVAQFLFIGGKIETTCINRVCKVRIRRFQWDYYSHAVINRPRCGPHLMNGSDG